MILSVHCLSVVEYLSSWLLINDTDPAGQLQWLTEQLLEAEKNGESVSNFFPQNLVVNAVT